MQLTLILVQFKLYKTQLTLQLLTPIVYACFSNSKF